MTQEEQQRYRARIMEANRGELVVIIYELFLHTMKEAGQAFEKGDSEEGVRLVKKAEAFLQELMGSLDRRYEIAEPLMRLYRYVYEQLIFSVIRRTLVHEETVCHVMERLRDAFAVVAREDHSGPVMQNTQKIYAGLTYGKTSVNEVLLSGDEANRGFRI